jgi:hypothetical protein
MPEAAPASQLPNRLRWLSVLILGLTLVCGVLAAVEFRALRHIILVDVPLSQAELTQQPDSICGQFRTGLPKFRLRWDGEPPRAWLADRQTGEALAPPLLLESSLSLNSRGVLWRKEGDCRFAVDRATYETIGSDLILRVEKIGSRSTFYSWSLATLICGLIAFICRQQARIHSVRLPLRAAAHWNETRSMAFVLLSLASVLVFFPGHPVAHMSGDPANIHSFAAALESPDEMAGDAVLSDTRNFKWYTPLYVKVVQAFGWMGFHYSTSRAFLALVSSLAGLFGYYHLFRIISRSAAFACVATLGLWFLKAHYPPNENWGPMLVLPRTVYGALMPWVAVLALRLMSRPQWWWLPAAASGLLFYVHPVSSPAITGTILMGFVFGGPGKWWTRLAWGTLGGAAAVAIMFPYVMIYAGKYSGTVVPDAAVTAQAFEIARQRFAPGYLEPLVFYRDLAVYFACNPRYWMGIAAMVLLCRYRRGTLTTRVSIGMTLGFVIVTCLIPTLDVIVSSRMGRLPFQIDLIRNLRYLDVWLLAIIAAALREVNRPDWGRAWALQFRVAMTKFLNPREISWRLVPAAAVVWTLVFYVPSAARSTYRLVEFSYDNLTILVGQPYGEMAQEMEAFRAVKTMRRPNEVVGGSFHMRQMHIPVAYNNKDLGVLAYSSPADLVAAKNVLRQSADRMVWPLDQSAAIDQAAILNAEILLLSRDEITPGLAQSDRVLFQNASHILVRLDPKQVIARRKSLDRGGALMISGEVRTRH